MRTVCIIQARMGSTRLPGKVLLPVFDNYPILLYMLDRIVVPLIDVDEVVIATTPNSEEIWDLCYAAGIQYFIGSEDNVFERVLDCANAYCADIIVDLTSDCPFVCPYQISEAIEKVKNGMRYVSNIYPRSWPDGFDIQVYRKELLEMVHPLIEEKYLQHSGWNILHYMHQYVEQYGFNITAPIHYAYPNMRLTLDYPEDYTTIKAIIEKMEEEGMHGSCYKSHCACRFPSAEDIIDFVMSNKELLTNKHLESKQPGE